MADALTPSAREEVANPPSPAETSPTLPLQPTVIDDVVARLLAGTGFLAVIGTDRSACGAAANALLAALAAHSVRVLIVRGPDEGGLRLTTLAAQLLGRPEAAFDPDDIEKLFDVLTDQAGSGRPVILIVDGAEALRQDAVNYLRLLSTLASEVAPQIVFCAQPAFWQVADDLRTLIAAQWVLTDDDIGALRPRIAEAESAGAAIQTVTPRIAASGTSVDGVGRTAKTDPTKPAGTYPIPLFDNFPGRSVLRVPAAPAPVSVIDAERADLVPGLETIRLAEATPNAPLSDQPARRPRRWVRNVGILAGIAIVVIAGAEANRRLDPSGPVAGLVDRHLAPAIAPLSDVLRVQLQSVLPGGSSSGTDASATSAASAEAGVAKPAAGDARPAYSSTASSGPPVADAPHTGAAAPTPAPVGPANGASGARGQGTAATAPVAPAGTGTAAKEMAPPGPTGASGHATGPVEPSPPVPTATTAAAKLKADRAGAPDPIAKPEGAARPGVAPKGDAVSRPDIAPKPDATARTDPPARAETTAKADATAKPDASAADQAARGEPADVKALLARGDKLLAMGDIAAARLLYERAASLGSGRAATSVGKTYDPAFLATLKVTGPRPDAGFAASWYRSGLTLGDPEAPALLDRLAGGGSGR
ncbi:MAG: hypothetical protein U1E70_24980 [Acetobacteraceae bacterium]